MKLSESVTRRILDLVARKTLCVRKADVVIGGEADPYMHRWYVIPRNRFFNIYFHFFMRSDDDRALHDHPWWNVSLLLEGSYLEHTIEAGGVHKKTRFEAGDLKFRAATYAHRIELDNGPVATLFITGPVIREWGFHCPNGWRHRSVFAKPGSPGEIGLGCGEE